MQYLCLRSKEKNSRFFSCTFIFNSTTMKLKHNIAVSQSGFIFNPATGDSFSVNEIAIRILEMLRNQQTPASILATLAEEYETDRETLERDLNDFLLHLQQLGMVEDEQ